MRTEHWLCFAGTELANGNRTLAYVRELLCDWDVADCDCEAVDENFTLPHTAPEAPWFDPEIPESGEFLGLFADVTVDSVIRRKSTELARGGASVGALRLRPRVVGVGGMMFATTAGGMWYGQRWLEEVLAGGMCKNGCAADELEILPHCDETAVRRLLGVGVVDGPVFTESPGLHDNQFQRFGFQFMAGVPHLFSRSEECLSQAIASSGNGCCLVSNPEWRTATALEVEIKAGTTEATDLRITAHVSLEGTCPEDRVPPCVDIEIPVLQANSTLTVDALRQQVRWRNPIALREESGLGLTEWRGAFPWPEVAPCTDLCVCVSNDGSQPVDVVVRSSAKEL